MLRRECGAIHAVGGGGPPTAPCTRRAASSGADTNAEEAWRAMARVCIRAPHGGRLRWVRGPLPVIRNIHVLRDADAFLGLDRRALVHDSSAPRSSSGARATARWRHVASVT